MVRDTLFYKALVASLLYSFSPPVFFGTISEKDTPLGRWGRGAVARHGDFQFLLKALPFLSLRQVEARRARRAG